MRAGGGETNSVALCYACLLQNCTSPGAGSCGLQEGWEACRDGLTKALPFPQQLTLLLASECVVTTGGPEKLVICPGHSASQVGIASARQTSFLPSDSTCLSQAGVQVWKPVGAHGQNAHTAPSGVALLARLFRTQGCTLAHDIVLATFGWPCWGGYLGGGR